MKNIMIILFLFVLLFNSITAQEILWKKNFGLSIADDIGRSVIETSDGGIAVVGYTGSFSGSNDVWLIKTNADGDTLWTKTYGGTNGDFGFSIKQTNDGGFIIGGATYSFGAGGADFYLIRTDSSGDTLWTRTFGDSSEDFCYSVDLTFDGSVILAGVRTLNPDQDFLIIKVDSVGNKSWEKIYGDESSDDVAYNIKSTSEGGYIVVGSVDCTTGPLNALCNGWLLKLNSDGDTLFTKIMGTSEFSDWFQHVTQTKDDGYIITGRLYNGAEDDNLWLLKTDSLGNVEWEKTYDYQNDYDIGYSVYQSSDGGYIVCGSAVIDEGASFGWIIRTNEFGDVLWTQEVHSYVESNILSSINTTFFSVIQASNGDYVVTGMQPILPVSDHAQQVVLLRISSDIVPVELTSFTATVQRNAVSLNWQTATETNNSGFEMQRSEMSTSKVKWIGRLSGLFPASVLLLNHTLTHLLIISLSLLLTISLSATD